MHIKWYCLAIHSEVVDVLALHCCTSGRVDSSSSSSFSCLVVVVAKNIVRITLYRSPLLSAVSVLSICWGEPTALKQSYIWTPAFDLNCIQWAGIDLQSEAKAYPQLRGGRPGTAAVGARAGSCGMSLADKRTRRQNASDVQIIHRRNRSLFLDFFCFYLSSTPLEPVWVVAGAGWLPEEPDERETAVKMRVFHLKRYDTTCCWTIFSLLFFFCLLPRFLIRKKKRLTNEISHLATMRVNGSRTHSFSIKASRRGGHAGTL